MPVLACPPDRLRADIVKQIERTITDAFRRASTVQAHNRITLNAQQGEP
jgi:hypothetical protein